MTTSLFCDECGAALADQTMYCSVCGQHIDTSSLSPLSTFPAMRLTINTPLPAVTMAAPSAVLQPGSRLMHRYKIIGQIGQGGFATVYKAQDRYQRNRLVAIKQINLYALSPKEMIEATDAYNREVMLLSQLEHANLPRIYDHFTDSAHWYVVMEYIEGETLEDHLKKLRTGRLPLVKALDIGIELCDVLRYLHTQHPPIIFRDLKPANIMMTPSGHLYLIDFGIARHYRPGQNKDTGPLGSVGYAAPEQYGKAQTTTQTDIYGLGATLQTLITGKEPLEIAASSAPLNMPQQLYALIAQMLAHDANKRPRNTNEVKLRLLHFKENLVSQKVKRVLAFIKELLRDSPTLLFSCLLFLFFLYFVCFMNGFFNTLLWIPYTLVATGAAIWSIAASIYNEEMESCFVRLTTRDKVLIAWRRLPMAVLWALLLGVFFYFIYDIQNPYNDFLIPELSVIVVGICTVICVGFYWGMNCLARWRKARSLRARAHKMAEPPLQQQMHR